MARLAGVTIPSDKRIIIALTYIFGVGPTTAQKIIEQTKIDPNIRTKDLTDDQLKLIRTVLEKDRQLEGDLRREILGNIKRLKEIGAYRGNRHSRRLPCNGQRTKTNSRTVRGNARRTMGSGRRALTKT